MFHLSSMPMLLRSPNDGAGAAPAAPGTAAPIIAPESKPITLPKDAPNYSDEERAFMDETAAEEPDTAPPAAATKEPAPLPEGKPGLLGDIAAAAGAKPEGEAAAGAEPALGEDGKPATHVPFAKFNEARHEAKTLKEQTQHQAALIAQQTQQLERFAKALERIAPEPEAEPLTIEQRLEQMEQQQQQAAAQQQHNTQRQAFIADYRADVTAFAKTTPDFMDAYNHALGVRHNMWEATGMPEAEINQLLEQEEAAIVARARQQGRSPAEAIYNVAKAFGYGPKAGAAASVAAVGAQPAGQAPAAAQTAPAAAAPPAKSAAELKMETVAAGQAASKSLANAPGSGDISPSLEDIINMKPGTEEFEKATSGKKWEKLFG